ncbi:MAG: phosphomannomutase [Zetaproteobacteria bacterium CG2_30_46_52]|nr:MAG: phosphomannomutase [Zetaproteobacteria bacterium CG2_30_46_52]
MTEQMNIKALMQTSGVKFGTSGARGLVVDMTDKVCYAYTLAFLQYLTEHGDIQLGDQVAVAGDLRPSSPRMMAAVGAAISDAGFVPLSCGFVSTPAVALYAMKRNMACMMVTGSHIPDDRNGIKFYKPTGEILKGDEQGMTAKTVSLPANRFAEDGALLVAFAWADKTDVAYHEYVKRFLDFFPSNMLAGQRIGIYEHSSVARDCMLEVVQKLGAEAISLGRSDTFIPVDTEAVRPEDVVLAKQWASELNLDCIISADGDGDRPLVSDEFGAWLRGDVAGIVCAKYLHAKAVVTPVSSNSALEATNYFEKTTRTRIGSPFVIEAMHADVFSGINAVVGYEANGGFLSATPLVKNAKTLSALPTRDALIVPLTVLGTAIAAKQSISALLKTLPQRFTASDRVQNFAAEKSEARLADLKQANAQANIFAANHLLQAMFGDVTDVDITDGVRVTFASSEIVHLRPSGNAPELRCYVEAASESRVQAMLLQGMGLLESWK